MYMFMYVHMYLYVYLWVCLFVWYWWQGSGPLFCFNGSLSCLGRMRSHVNWFQHVGIVGRCFQELTAAEKLGRSLRRLLMVYGESKLVSSGILWLSVTKRVKSSFANGMVRIDACSQTLWNLYLTHHQAQREHGTQRDCKLQSDLHAWRMTIATQSHLHAWSMTMARASVAKWPSSLIEVLEFLVPHAFCSAGFGLRMYARTNDCTTKRTHVRVRALVFVRALIVCFMLRHRVWLIICRFGKREGFHNVVKSRCHSVGTAFMRRSAVNIHENVVGYDEAFFCICLNLLTLSMQLVERGLLYSCYVRAVRMNIRMPKPLRCTYVCMHVRIHVRFVWLV